MNISHYENAIKSTGAKSKLLGEGVAKKFQYYYVLQLFLLFESVWKCEWSSIFLEQTLPQYF